MAHIIPTHNDESWSIRKSTVMHAVSALRIGLENTKELLHVYDSNSGRGTRSLKCTAERLESDIASAIQAIDILNKPDGEPFPTKED